MVHPGAKLKRNSPRLYLLRKFNAIPFFFMLASAQAAIVQAQFGNCKSFGDLVLSTGNGHKREPQGLPVLALQVDIRNFEDNANPQYA